MNGSRHSLLSVGVATGLLFAAVSAPAQETEESDIQAWIQYEYQHRITEKLRGSWDLGYRELVSAEDVLGEWSRLHLRGIFSYVHRNWVTFDGGFGGYYTFSDNPSDLFELRTWQSAVLFWPTSTLVGRQFDPRHRIRLEQRWTWQQDTNEKDFGDLGGDSLDFFAARLRLSLGVGSVLSDNWTLEFR